MDDHDTEMITMNNVQLQNHHQKQNGDTTLFVNEIDSDDDDSASEDDGSRGLLTGSSERTYRHEQRQPPGQQKSVWPQIKSIVIEVRVQLFYSSFMKN
jgi:hypothetical protein